MNELFYNLSIKMRKDEIIFIIADTQNFYASYYMKTFLPNEWVLPRIEIIKAGK